jgi:cytochrome P450
MPPSFAKYLLENQSTLALTFDQTAYLAGSIFGAGSDTTASAISIGVLAAACFPEEARRVKEELDSVVGAGRPPTLADQDALPRTYAFVMETFRWRPVTAGGASFTCHLCLILFMFRVLNLVAHRFCA